MQIGGQVEVMCLITRIFFIYLFNSMIIQASVVIQIYSVAMLYQNIIILHVYNKKFMQCNYKKKDAIIIIWKVVRINIYI